MKVQTLYEGDHLIAVEVVGEYDPDGERFPVLLTIKPEFNVARTDGRMVAALELIGKITVNGLSDLL